ncbi:ABC transporter ATP-binding protein [Nocardia terpenica]|uniref:ATP-binding cassette domain-containing protein n=1 Tax=Nocardia terpenica TaxID=455432 RepID=A0A6G9YZ41_9NOCA|nr:ABC transporter ATP-binding protein [Nocardia terpenica]QIS18440.1 ATP-binding cassette domain-containing protein [Nocardia terpenica]
MTGRIRGGKIDSCGYLRTRTVEHNPQDVIVEAAGLTKRFGPVTAVADFDLTVERGEIVGLLGVNGAGKTTTLHMLLGLTTPDSGSIRIFGSDYERHRHEILARLNFAASLVGLPGTLQVREVLDTYARLYSLRNPAAQISKLASLLELGPLLRRPVGSLSSGQQTRVQIAKAMLNEPELLILDEPTANLDPDNADRVRSVLTEFSRASGTAMVITSHNIREIEQMADRVLIMAAGRVVSRGTAHELTRKHGVRDLEELFIRVARQ